MIIKNCLSYSKLCINLCQHKWCHTSAQSNLTKFKDTLKLGPQFGDFVTQQLPSSVSFTEPFVVNRNNPVPYIDESLLKGNGKRVHIKTYGCQMNVNDTQIASTVLTNSGYEIVNDINKAEIVFLMTCAIREHAESKIWAKLKELRYMKSRGKLRQIGLLGCMAERLKTKLIDREKCVDIVAGPDSYKDLPKLLAINNVTGVNAINVMLSIDETYADIIPTVTVSSMSAYVSIMRGCDNMCSYCIVPFTRGRERSRPIESIVEEIRTLSKSGIKEVTLLGQNVNSYRDVSHDSKSDDSIVPGFKTIYKPKKGGLTFDVLLEEVAKVDPEMRIRFTSPHPKDFPDSVLNVIKKYPNIAKCIHLPAQSGNNDVLERMRRGYTKEAYINLVDHIRHVIPGCALTSDFICGFCGETQDEHNDTVDLVSRVNYNFIYVFHYSMREKTHAFHKMNDDVPSYVKIDRLKEVYSIYRENALKLNKTFIGKEQLILIEGDSKKSENDLSGRNDANLKVIIPKVEISESIGNENTKTIKSGDYIVVNIDDCNAQTFFGTPLYHTTLNDYYNRINENKL